MAEEGEGAERGRRAREAKAQGGAAFKAGRFMDAAEHYAAALQLFPAQSTEAVTCHSNRAQCFLSLGTHLDAALDVRPSPPTLPLLPCHPPSYSATLRRYAGVQLAHSQAVCWEGSGRHAGQHWTSNPRTRAPPALQSTRSYSASRSAL